MMGASRRPPLLIALAVTSCLVYFAYVGVGLALGMTYVSGAAEKIAALPRAQGIIDPAGGLSIASISIPFVSGAPVVLNPLDLFPTWPGTERINVLLLGMDQRPEERVIGTPTRSDTLMVVSIDPVLKTGTMVSFPRDLWVAIPGFGEERINAAYRFGEINRGTGGGPALAARTIEQNFSLRTPYYATVDFAGFQEIINTLGGIVIDLRRPLKDDAYPTDNYGIERVYFAPGPQIMDGATALKYTRTRHADSDFGRMTRQQQVLFAIRDRALRLNMLPRVPQLMDQGLRAVQTNLTPVELLGLARLAGEIETSAVGTLVVENQLVTPITGAGGASLLVPKREEIRRAIRNALADPGLVREAGRVEIVSSPTSSRLAQQVADRLAGEGLQVARRSETGLEAETTAVALFAAKPRTLAVTLRALGLGSEKVREAPADDGAPDIRVTLGPDFQLPASS